MSALCTQFQRRRKRDPVRESNSFTENALATSHLW